MIGKRGESMGPPTAVPVADSGRKGGNDDDVDGQGNGGEPEEIEEKVCTWICLCKLIIRCSIFLWCTQKNTRVYMWECVCQYVTGSVRVYLYIHFYVRTYIQVLVFCL